MSAVAFNGKISKYIYVFKGLKFPTPFIYIIIEVSPPLQKIQTQVKNDSPRYFLRQKLTSFGLYFDSLDSRSKLCLFDCCCMNESIVQMVTEFHSVSSEIQ